MWAPGNAGVPDRIIVLPGNKVEFVELKKPGEKPSELQKAQIRILQKLGCKVIVIDSIEQIDKFLDELGGNIDANIKSKKSIDVIKK